MSDGATKIGRLSRLRDRLAEIPPHPWGPVEAWVAEATPIIQTDWPAYLDSFKEVAKRPRFVTSLRVYYADGPSQSLSPKTNAENKRRAERAHARLVSFLAGLLQCAESEVEVMGVVSSNIDTRNVFVVHGRNETARRAMFAFLRAAGLHPLQWGDILEALGQGTPYVGDVLEKGFSMAQAVVVLFTPDDEARLREQYRGGSEPEHETDLTPQPRQNVLVEAGMALGMHRDRTIIVEMGRMRPVSDIIGRHTIRMDGSAEKRNALISRLRTAGCAVTTTSNDWLTEGDFQKVLDEIHQRSSEPPVPPGYWDTPEGQQRIEEAKRHFIK